MNDRENMRRNALFLLFVLFFCVNALADTYRVATSSSLNVRAEPSLNSEVIGRLQNGDIVDVLNIVDNWAEIKVDNRKAYISSAYLEPYSGNNEQTQTIFQGRIIVPIIILVLTLLAIWLWKEEYYWWGVSATIVLLGLIYFYLANTENPLWFLTERGVGFGLMLLNMFITFVTIMFVWNCVTSLLTFFGVDPITLWGAKFLFVLTVYCPGNNLIFLLLLWGFGYSIFCSIKKSDIDRFVCSVIGLTMCGVIVYHGGELCEKVFYGFDALILVIALFPQLLECVPAGNSSSSTQTSQSSPQYKSCCNCVHWNWFDSSCNRENPYKVDPDESGGCPYYQWNTKT